MRRSRFAVLAMVFSLVAGLTAGLPPVVVQAAGTAATEPSVPVQSLASQVAPLPPMAKHVSRPVVWPSAASAEVQLPVVAGRRAEASATIGGLPVTLSPLPVQELTGELPTSSLRVKVDVLDRPSSAKAGAPVALRLSRSDGGSGPAKVNVRLDYNGFRDAFGGAWAARLALWQIPECGLSPVPADAARRRECVGAPLVVDNDFKAGVLSAEVDLAAPLKTLSPPVLSEREKALIGIEAVEPEESVSTGVSVLALTSSGKADGVGTFAKTDLKATYAWNGGSNTGNFTFSYPMSVPQVPGGLAPELGLDYSSQAVDGQTAGENIQSGLIGEGWSLTAGGFIESTFRSCGEDQDHTPYWPDGVDTCVRLENYQLAWGANSGELVPAGDGTRNLWVSASDDGLKAEQVTSGLGGTAKPYWKITTTDGTQWFFGRQRLPGWTAGARETNSTLSQQIWANHSDEPCFNSGSFYNSHCLTVYRWNLDYVLDVHGNSMSYWYERFTNLHGSNGNGWNEKWYERDAVLTRIEYGTRAGNETTATPPAVVEFTNDDRCLDQCWNGTIRNDANWKDTPWDLECTAPPCQAADYYGSQKDTTGPTYWTHKRLAKVTTKVRDASTGTPKPVDEWVLGHAFTGGTDVPVLWLDSVTRTGFDSSGTGTSLPPLTTHGFTANNRADYDPNASMAEPIKTRIDYIDNETGGRIAVSYLPRDEPKCVWTSGKPLSAWPDYNHNGSRCFQQFTSNRSGQPGYSWWHKFVVDKVTETDLVGSSPQLSVETSYTYSMDGAEPANQPVLWGYASNPWGTINKTMSAWKGYPTVVTTVGPTGGPQTRTKRLYYRGLDRDTGLNAGQEFFRDAWIRDSNNIAVEDHQALAGRVREEIVYNGPTETDAISKTVHDFSVTHTQGSGLPGWQTPPERKSYRARETSTKSFTKVLADNSWRTTEVASSFDGQGTLEFTNDKGDINGTLADNICSRYEYARNTNDLMLRAGTGSGLVAASASSAAADLSAYDILFSPGDFDGDGRKDLLGRNNLGTHLYLLKGNGTGAVNNGTFATPARIGTYWGTGGYLFSPGDFSGDGKPDMLYRNEANLNLYMLRGNGTGGWVTGTGEQIGAGWVDEAFFSPGDITGDGKPDVMFRRASDGKLMYIRGNGAGGWIDGANLVADGGNWKDRDQIFGRGDATGDGKTDLYARTAATGELKLYPGNGNGTFATPVSLGTGWNDYTKLATAGDITNNDGKLDLLGVQGGGYLPNTVRRVHSVGADCGAQPVYPADFIADVRNFYDDRHYGAPPARGLVTRTETVKSVSGQTVTGFVVTTAGFDAYGRPLWTKDPLNRQTTTAYTHNTAGLLASTTVTNPASHTITAVMDPRRGQLMSVTDANNKTTRAEYDRLGRLIKVFQPGNTTATGDVEYVYSITKTAAPYTATKVIGPNGNQITSYEILDGFLRPRQTQTITEDGKRTITDTAYDTRGLAAKTSTFYNADSAPTSQLVKPINDAAIAQQVRYDYDLAGRKTKDQLYSNNVLQWQTQTVYGGDRVGIIPPTGGTPTQDIFDARGRVVEKRQYSGTPFTGAFAKTSYDYDDAGRLTTVTDPAANPWTYEYDLLGRKTKTVDPDAGTSTSAYDDAGQVTSTTDGLNQALFYEYDNLGRKTKLRDGSATGTVMAQWTYDTYAKGQPAESIRYIGADAYTTRVTAWNDNYQPLTTELVIPNDTINKALAGTYTWTHTYKPNGAPATTELPGVGGLPAEKLTYSYDNNGYAQTLVGTWSGGAQEQIYIANTDYTYDGLIAAKVLGKPGDQVKLTNQYQPHTRRLSANTVATETATPGTFTDKFATDYTYDQAGNITTIGGYTDGTRDQVECFRYDHLARLTEAWTQATTGSGCATAQRTGADPYWRQWTFDTVGNRLTQTDKDPAAGDTTWTYTVGAAGGVKAHQLKTVTAVGPKAGTATRSFGYDTAGNTTSAVTATGAAQTLDWDKEGHLATVVEGATTKTNLYDADGNRLIVRTPQATTLYLPDGTELELQPNDTVLGTRYYGSDAVRDAAAGLTWTVANHQNTSLVQINADDLTTSRRRRALPYGEDRTTTPTGWIGTKGYVGGTKDTTGYTHLGAREYDPTLGRFISTDPVMDLTDPRQWHAYSYANGSPVTLSDPTGLKPQFDDLEDQQAWQDSGGNQFPGNKTSNPTPTDPAADAAQKAADDAKKQLIGAAKELLKIAMDELGITAAMDCFTTGNLGACAETALNIASSFVGGLAGKLLAKYGSPWKWAKGAQLVKRIWGALENLVTGVKNWFHNSKLAQKLMSGASCLHSFAPGTLVLMADGTTKPIEDIDIGEVVLAADPETGETYPKQVTDLHINQDWDLAEVAIHNDETGTTTVLETTWHHPFWNATDQRWTNAAELTQGTRLLDNEGKETQQVAAVRTWTGLQQMHDLTVADIHTYYVVAGTTPVLVHNCGPGEKFNVPSRPGVYTVHLEDGSKYVGMATRDMRDRVNKTMKDGHALFKAGYTLADVKNVTFIELPRGFGGRRASRTVARRIEQSVVDGWKELGANVIHDKYPEFRLWYH